MILETRAVPPFMKNGFVIGCEETREGVVIDPGDDVDLLLEAVEQHGLSIRYILLTHAHLDHISGVRRALAYEIRRQTSILERGKHLEQETRGWNDATGETFLMRTKEFAHDYRYFPDPDLVPVDR